MSSDESSLQDLESPEALRSQRREWIAERIGWLAIALVLLAGLLGLLGRGPLSHVRRTSSDGSLAVEYYALERYHAPTRLIIRLREPASAAPQVRLAISRRFADSTIEETIVPRPVLVESRGDELVYTLRMSEIDEQGAIIIRYEHDEFGALPYHVRIDGPAEVPLSQFVFP